MIIRDVVLTVNQDTVKLNNKLYCYIEDGAFNLHIRVVNLPFRFDTDTIYVDAIIKQPNGVDITTVYCTEVEKNVFELPILKEYLDEIQELGEHKIQLQFHSQMLEDGSFTDCASLPPFSMEVKSKLDSKIYI